MGKDKHSLVGWIFELVTSSFRLGSAGQAERPAVLPQAVCRYEYLSNRHYGTCIDVIRQFTNVIGDWFKNSGRTSPKVEVIPKGWPEQS